MRGINEEFKTFKIDEENSDDERIHINILGLGTVVIIRTDEGIVIDVFSKIVVDDFEDNLIYSTWLLDSDFQYENEEE